MKPEVSIAKLDTKLEYIQKTVDSMAIKLDEFNKVYATKLELADCIKETEEKVSLIRKIVFTACAVILLGVLYTWLGSIGIKAE